MKGDVLADWLRLREPVDHRSRSKRLAASLAAHFAGRETVSVIDLGAGSGSNLRATTAHLPARQSWTLVDHDPVVLAAAHDAIARWADAVYSDAGHMEVAKGESILRIEFREADLARDPAVWRDNPSDLVTSSALFDLVSDEWICGFTDSLARAALPLYTTLIYDGRTEFSPPHPADAAVAMAFAHHHERDKGFGPGIGGRGGKLIAERLRGLGYQVDGDPSPWQLGLADRPLLTALVQGYAEAARETGEVPDDELNEWLAARLSGGIYCRVGHEDLLAFPGRPPR